MQETLLKQEQSTGAHAKTAPKPHRPWWQSALQFSITLAIGVLALEAAFNYAGVGNEEFLEPDSKLGVRHIAGKKVVWRLEGYSDEFLSSQGLRDTEHAFAKPADTYRIALLGDSATEGMQVPLSDTYGKQLEQLLGPHLNVTDNRKVEVINFGCSSYSNGQETLQLEQQVAKYNPDLVIMMYNRGDYIENIRDPSTMKAEPRPYFRIDDNGQLVQDDTIMLFNKKGFEPQPVQDFLRKNSRIYGVLTHMNLALSLNELAYSKLRNSILKLLPGAKDQWKRVNPPYTIKDPWAVTQTVIARANADCKQLKSKFMLVCFPNIVNDQEYGRQIDSLKKQAADQGFAYLDLTQYYKGENSKSLFLKYHFSSAGHSVAARRIADQVYKAR